MVVVEERGAVAVGVDDEVLGGPAGDVDEIETGLGGHVHEADRRTLRARRHHPQPHEERGQAKPGCG